MRKLTRQEWKMVLAGAVAVFLLFLIGLTGVAGWIVWRRAYNGEAAYEYIQKVIDAQQKAQSPNMNPPPPGPPVKP